MSDSLQTLAKSVLLSLLAIEAGLTLVALGMYKAPILTWAALPTKAGVCALVGGSVTTAAMGFMLHMGWAAGSAFWRPLKLALVLNFWFVGIALGLMEGVVRWVSVTMPTGIRTGEARLLATWPELVAQSRDALARGSTTGSWDAMFLIHDRELGWTVGRNRRDPSGRYSSSEEGIRSAQPGTHLGDRKSRFRVALLGDSNAFSLEVPFEDSWGAQLELMLGRDVQVLNFGVDGYGVDQMFLRYKRDVRPWRPDVVVIGFIGDDLLRSMSVYPFVSFGWPGFIVKPRFALEDGELRLLNTPLPAPEEVLGTKRIRDLPFIDHDLGYATNDWDWRWSQTPFLVRLLISLSPHWRTGDRWVSTEATVSLNRQLFNSLRDTIDHDGAAAVFVEMSDLGSTTGDWYGQQPTGGLVDATLSGTQIALIDVAPCLSKLSKAERRMPSGYHFNGKGNRAIAECTAGPIASRLRMVPTRDR